MSKTQYEKSVQQANLQDTDDEGEVCIGSLGQQKVYLHWSDVKDICTNAVSEAYEQARKENEQLKSKLQLKETAYDFDTARLEEENATLKELLKECKGLFNRATVDGAEPNNAELIEILTKISQVLGEK